MSDKAEILFNVNYKGARMHKYIPKHARAEDAPKGCELQFRNVLIRPNAAAAVLLAEDGAAEIIQSFFKGESFQPRFFGGGDFHAPFDFKAKHKIKIDGLPYRKVDLLSKIRLRLEGGPNQLIWCDFSVYIEDPEDEDTIHYHDVLNHDCDLVIVQQTDLVDEMLAHARGMAVSTTVADNNGNLDLDGQAAADADRAKAVGDTLDQQNAAASKASRKKAAKQKAA